MRYYRPFLLIGLGAILSFLFDPTSGRRRRAEITQRVPAMARRRQQQAERLGRQVAGQARGVTAKVVHLREVPKPQPNDATLAAKVETKLFRDPASPKGRVIVNAEKGVIQLRGEVADQDTIDRVIAMTQSIQGVQGVESFLHLPGVRPADVPPEDVADSPDSGRSYG